MVRSFSSKGTAARQMTHGVLRVAPSLARAGEPVSHIPGQGSETFRGWPGHGPGVGAADDRGSATERPPR